MALGDGVADKGVVRPQIEDVVLVDARRDDDERPAVHFARRRRGLDQLDQLLAENPAPRRQSQIAADAKGRLVGERDAAALRVADQVGKTPCEAYPSGLER